MLTKQHFVRFAQYINGLTADDVPANISLDATKNQLAVMVMQIGKESNPKFDEFVFLRACGLSK